MQAESVFNSGGIVLNLKKFKGMKFWSLKRTAIFDYFAMSVSLQWVLRS